MEKDRVTFIVDGFNLYHSCRNAEDDLGGKSTKWLNIAALCKSYLYLFGQDASIEEIYYFSALAKHLEADNPNVTRRHRKLIRCLKDAGIKVELSRFKKKRVYCSNCSCIFTKYEEKETDVAIAAKLLEILFTDKCDSAVIVSGDTDLAPAFSTADRLFPEKRIVFAFPYKRKNKELQKLAPGSFYIGKAQYAKHQFPNIVTLSDGATEKKPAKW